MTVETKFNIGDEVWFVDEHKAHQGKVKDNIITIKGSTQSIKYFLVQIRFNFGGCAYVREYRQEVVFKTKEELIESLFN